jgi:hypothetical protein
VEIFDKAEAQRPKLTGCATLGPGSEATVYLTVRKAALGDPYRIRADYLGDSPENASGASAWQYVMVEK